MTTRRTHGLRLLLIGDSQLTLQAAIGRATSIHHNLRNLHSNINKTLFLLHQHLAVEPGGPNGGVHWVPRGENSAADALATKACQDERTHVERDFTVPAPAGSYLLLYFDGGSRNDGQTSGCGCAVVVLAPDSIPRTLYRGSFFLGPGSNNYAEGMGLLLGLQAVVSFVLRSGTH